MLGIIQFLQKKPSDAQIKTGKIVFGVIFTLSIWYNLIWQGDMIDNTFLGFSISAEQINIIKYIIMALGILPIITGITDICFLKSKYTRILQIVTAFLYFYISSLIVSGAGLDVDTLILIMAFFPLFGGITGKFITTKGLKYGYVVTKIRV